ncbi:MAG: cysteine synthase family protein [Candidatus Handelsmanbacteria bacterium]|nr:cysteine synthase family protein [Candidatus Handelsmanbacteria bacterium]
MEQAALPGKAPGQTVVEQIGNTPLLRLHDPSLPPRVEVYAKLEFFNPGGSVKDRPARRMIEEGAQSGQLRPGKTILDSTSGNTGIAYAMIGAAKGYPVLLAMPGSVTQERRAILAAYGAEVVLTDPGEGSDGAILEARRLYEAAPERYFKPDQYNNPANWQAHRDTTAPEIWAQTQGRVTHFVATMGTSGTVMGTGRGLKAFNPRIQVIGAEPAEPFHGIEGLKHMASSIVPGIYDEGFLDHKIRLETDTAYDTTLRLARELGVLAGQSSGAAYWAALEVGRQLREGVVVTVFCDGGDKYMSTPMWRQALKGAVSAAAER